MMNEHLPPRILTVLLFVLTCTLPALCGERVVDLTAADGTRLKATYFSAAKPGSGVLLLHQCNRQRKVWDDLARQLAAAGINVLTLDHRGFGESGGERAGKMSPADAAAAFAKLPGDIDLALQYLESQSGVTREMIGVGGASCGVDDSIQTARRHPEVRSLVLLSGSTDYPGRQFLRSDTSVPALFTYADDDEFTATVLAIPWLYSITANPGKKLVHYPTGGHGSDIFSVHPEFPRLIVDWYVTTLITTPGRAPASKDAWVPSQQVRVLNMIDEPGGPAKVMQMVEDAQKQKTQGTLFDEATVNTLGYQHLQSGDNKGAIEILKLNVAAYPKSPNVYDSLADAYLADGQTGLARQNAWKTLELLPSDTTDNEQRRNAIKGNAEQKLKQLNDMP
jgi:dienelactone hydrolase